MESYAADALFLPAKKLSAFAKQQPTPFYLYDETGIRQTAAALHGAFGALADFRQYFPIAMNPHPALLRLLHEAGYGVLCENEAQLRLAASCGFTGEEILFTPMAMLPPAETLARELDCTFVLDGPHALPRRAPRRALLSLRPTQKLRLDDGSTVSFENLKTGMPEDALLHLAERLVRGGSESVGLILHACRNDLREGYYPAIAQALFTCAVHLREQTGLTPDCCNLSDGLGVAYHRSDREPELSAVAERIAALRADILLPAGLADLRLETALGRYALAKHAIFVARVAAVKPMKNAADRGRGAAAVPRRGIAGNVSPRQHLRQRRAARPHPLRCGGLSDGSAEPVCRAAAPAARRARRPGRLSRRGRGRSCAERPRHGLRALPRIPAHRKRGYCPFRAW